MVPAPRLLSANGPDQAVPASVVDVGGATAVGDVADPLPQPASSGARHSESTTAKN